MEKFELSKMAAKKGFDGFDALEILDEYAWLEVFKRVDDAQDLHSLSNTCVRFQNLLEHSKCGWGFELNLPQIAPYLFDDDEINDDWTELLELRVISKRWCKAVDTFLSGPSHLVIGGVRKPRLFYSFRTTQAIEEFQQEFGNWRKKKNPFPSRAVKFSSANWIFGEITPNHQFNAEEQQLWAAYIRKNFELIEDFGEHIHFLILGSDCVSGSSRDRYETIRNLLVNLPNLKSLSLPAHLTNFAQVDRDQVANYLNENPLPELPHLEDLELSPACEKFDHFFLAKWAPQLKSVSILSLSDAPTRLVIQDMLRLEKLELFLDPNDPNNFEYLKLLPPTLKALSVHVKSEERQPQTFHIDKFLQVIRRCPLEALRIRIMTRVIITDSRDVEEYVNEGIQEFVFECCEAKMTTSFNFLESLKKAEAIKIFHAGFRPGLTPVRQHPVGVPERIQFYQYFQDDPQQRMYESNIWEKMPSLNTLNVYGSNADGFDAELWGDDVEPVFESFQATYSRNGYDRLRNQNA